MIEEIFPISVNEIFPKQKALGPFPKKAEKTPVGTISQIGILEFFSESKVELK